MIDARDRISPYLFLAPAILYLAIWIYYPIAKNFYLSFLGSDSTRTNDTYFVGLANYRDLLSDDLFFRALLHNLGKHAPEAVLLRSILASSFSHS
jgi:ABC-type sugar transport system permease subunit